MRQTSSSTTQLNALDEFQLVERVRSGCDQAWSILDQQMRPRLTAALHRRVRCQADCDDLAQQALWRAYQRIDQYDARWRFSTWLFTIAFRLASDMNRRKRHHASLQCAADTADSANTPAQRAIANELHNNLWTLADRVLGDHPFTVLWLHYGEGLTPAEIAQILEQKAASVRVTLHRARNVLRSHLSEDDSPKEREVCHAS